MTPTRVIRAHWPITEHQQTIIMFRTVLAHESFQFIQAFRGTLRLRFGFLSFWLLFLWLLFLFRLLLRFNSWSLGPGCLWWLLLWRLLLWWLLSV